MFALAYTRKVLQPDGSRTEEEVSDYALRRFRALHGEAAPLPAHFVTVQDLTRGIPSDIFRTCVARVSLWPGVSSLCFQMVCPGLNSTNASSAQGGYCRLCSIPRQQDMQRQFPPPEIMLLKQSLRWSMLLMQVLMMVFDILASHHKMTMWHDASLDQQMAALAKLRDAKRACHARLRVQHSLKKRLSFDAVMGLPDPESVTPPQDLISSAVGPSGMHGTLSTQVRAHALRPGMHVILSLFANFRESQCSLSCRWKERGVMALGWSQLCPRSLGASLEGLRRCSWRAPWGQQVVIWRLSMSVVSLLQDIVGIRGVSSSVLVA